MRDDCLDRSLSKEEEILPSSGFTASVMEAVRREAATPPPIAFPWKRALPGVVVGCATIIWLLYESVLQMNYGSNGTAHSGLVSGSVGSPLENPIIAAACWIILALVLSFMSVKLSMLLAQKPRT